MKVQKTFTGYINYRNFEKYGMTVKTHHFVDIPQEEVDALIIRFSAKGYMFIGYIFREVKTLSVKNG